MRQIDIADTNRVLLQSVELPTEPKSDKRQPTYELVKAGLRMELTTEAKNFLISKLIGNISYRSREFVKRVVDRMERDGSIDLFETWVRLGGQYLECRHTVAVRAEMFEQWRRAFHDLDEDVPSIALLAQRDADASVEVDPVLAFGHFRSWSTFARGEDRQLAIELGQGIACQHLHLAGAYPGPYFWVALMNQRFAPTELVEPLSEARADRYPELIDPDTLLKQIRVAIQLRRALYEIAKKFFESVADSELNGLGDKLDPGRQQEQPPIIDRGKTNDYATKLVHNPRHSIRAEETTCPSLLGERMLLYALFHLIARLRGHKKDDSFSLRLARAVWAYVQAKNVFLGFVQQQEGISGFDYFEYVLRRVSWMRHEDERERCAEEIGRFLQESSAVLKLELMIGPGKTETEYEPIFNILHTIQRTMTEQLSPDLKARHQVVQVGLVIHFIKEDGESLSARGEKHPFAFSVYHAKVRDTINERLAHLRKYLASDRYAEDRKPPRTAPELPEIEICAIDTANRELHCPPEIFGPLYQALSRQPLGRTYHVGEDFQHIMTGLRRIYEAIVFLGLRAGDRLGHCTALGANPKGWVRANPMVSIHRFDQLDDAVFEWALLREHGVGTPARLAELESRISTHSIAVYGTPINPHILKEAWYRRPRDLRGKESFGSGAEIPGWIKKQGEVMAKAKPRRGTHNVIPTIGDLDQIALAYGVVEGSFGPSGWPSDLAERLLLEYLYDVHTVRAGIELSPVETLPDLPHIECVQDLLRREVMSKGLTIESNPSSNWLIGGFERHSDVPAVQWLLCHPTFPLSINPDDPVTFSTSIENEYFMVFACLLKGTEQVPGLSRLEALERIRRVREQGLAASFLQLTR